MAAGETPLFDEASAARIVYREARNAVERHQCEQCTNESLAGED